MLLRWFQNMRDGAFQNIQTHRTPSAPSSGKHVLLASQNKVFNWMCYLLAAITIMPWGMNGGRKYLCLSSLLCFLKVTRDWNRHDSCGKPKVLHVCREMSMEWVFENNKSQLAEKASFELDYDGSLMTRRGFPVIKSNNCLNVSKEPWVHIYPGIYN